MTQTSRENKLTIASFAGAPASCRHAGETPAFLDDTAQNWSSYFHATPKTSHSIKLQNTQQVAGYNEIKP